MFNKKLLICFVSVLSHTVVFSQVKLSPQLKKNIQAEGQKTKLTLLTKDLGAFREKFGDKIAVVHTHFASNTITVSGVTKDLLKTLMDDPNILFIDHHEKVREEATLDHVNSNFNRITKAHAVFPTITGSGQKISIKEQSFDTADIDLKNRSFSTSVTPTTTSQHATTMATLVAGGGNSSWRALGAAPQAHFTSSDFTFLTPDDISLFTSNNIHLQNHSYGVGVENYYGTEAMAYDQQVFQNPTLLHVFSSGNSGLLTPTDGTYQGLTFANLTGNFKQAKNVLVVNAVDTTLSINSLNSRGPAFDGRVKPELTAFGQGGTSEASALASGISALVQEKFASVNNQPPDASMVKAILIASADDIGAKGIDYLYGYGSINAYQSLKLIALNQFVTTTLSSNDQISVPITISPAAAEIKIAVVWSDPPATVNSSTVLVNDIDSWLSDGTNTTLPWVLSSYPKTDSLLAPPKRKPDHQNNIEYITLTNPTAGVYQLYLKSGNLTNSSQNVSIAYWISDQKQFGWDFPDSTQIVEASKKSLLVWEAAADQKGDLHVQVNQSTWQLVKAGIDLNNYFYWTPPNIFAKAKLKMVIGANEFATDEFLISPELKLTTAFNCADSIGLVWNSARAAINYNVFAMGSQYLEKISSSVDTLKVLSKSNRQYYSIAPILNGKIGLKSEAINFTQQGALCYLDLFSAERFSATQIKISLLLSSWHTVDHVTIFKTVNGTQNVFANVPPSDLLSFDYLDSDLSAGSMTYQAEIFFNNGMNIFSDVIDIPIEGKGKVILYPNPVTSSNSDLNIISSGAGTFRILDLFGRTLLEKNIKLFEDAIDVVDLPKGLYIYQLLSGDQVTDTGRFVKY